MCWFSSRKAKNGRVCQNVPFCPILCPFLVKIDPKSVIFTKTWCFFTGRYHMGFKTKNWFIGDIGKHIQSFVSEFASLVHKMGLEPLNLRFFGLVQKAFETQNACHMWLLRFNGILNGWWGHFRWYFFLFKILKILLTFSLKNLN